MKHTTFDISYQTGKKTTYTGIQHGGFVLDISGRPVIMKSQVPENVSEKINALINRGDFSGIMKHYPGACLQVGDFEAYSCKPRQKATSPGGKVVEKWTGQSSPEYRHESDFSAFIKYENGYVEENPMY